MVKELAPDVFIAGPAFNAGRYGVACGTIAAAVQEELGIPSLTGMYVENRALTCSRTRYIWLLPRTALQA